MILTNFQHNTSLTGGKMISMSNLLRFCGLEIQEAVAFIIGQGLDCWFAGDGELTFSFQGKQTEENLLTEFKIPFQVNSGGTKEEIIGELVENLAQGKPILAKIDGYHFGNHFFNSLYHIEHPVVIYGVDVEQDQIYLSDYASNYSFNYHGYYSLNQFVTEWQESDLAGQNAVRLVLGDSPVMVNQDLVVEKLLQSLTETAQRMEKRPDFIQFRNQLLDLTQREDWYEVSPPYKILVDNMFVHDNPESPYVTRSYMVHVYDYLVEQDLILEDQNLKEFIMEIANEWGRLYTFQFYRRKPEHYQMILEKMEELFADEVRVCKELVRLLG